MTVSERDFVPASSLAAMYGVKMMAYGPPGGGKTPLIITAPRVAMLVLEPGMLSMRQSGAESIRAYPAIGDMKRADEWFEWAINSSESRNYDTYAVDSWTEYAQIVLRHYQGINKHGQKAYGEMALHVMAKARALYYLKQKHVYLICQEGKVQEDGYNMSKPVFPGQALNGEMPHLFDLVARVGAHQMNGYPAPVPSILCARKDDLFARDRSGRLAMFEPKDLGKLFAKAMS